MTDSFPVYTLGGIFALIIMTLAYQHSDIKSRRVYFSGAVGHEAGSGDFRDSSRSWRCTGRHTGPNGSLLVISKEAARARFGNWIRSTRNPGSG